MNSGTVLLLIPLLPLAAALLAHTSAATRGRAAARLCAMLGAGALGLSALLSAWVLRLGSAQFSVPWFTLPDSGSVIQSGQQAAGLPVALTFYAGPLQALFLLTTSIIALGVLLYARRERQSDPRSAQFFATLTLFAGSMLLFVAADTLLVLYFAWELMGVCSYLLIAHRGTAEARRAARQAFWTTRATDFSLLFGLLILMGRFNWTTLSSIDVGGAMSAVLQAGGDTGALKSWIGAAALLALLAVLGKAAQFPLSYWLPDAMVAPAPVSALLHAATMVAAGPYLLIRLHALFVASEWALLLTIICGGLTLVLGGMLALCAGDPKRVLAYSTVSQLGLVVLSVGALAEEAGYYHLLAHAWFKAALFLGVGYLVAIRLSSSHGRHDISLGELRGAARRWPLLLWGVLAPAGLALAGLYPLAGGLGKEQVLHALLTRSAVELQPGVTLGSQLPLAAAGWLIGAVLFIIALPITAAYTVRLIGILGWGKPDAGADGSESLAPATQAAFTGWQIALLVSAALALMGSLGWALAYPAFRSAFSSENAAWKWANTGSREGVLLLLVSSLLILAGGALAWHFNVARPRAGERALRLLGLNPLVGFFARGMYLREFFATLIGKTGELLALLAGIAELGVLDWLALRCGAAGRGLARAARWFDDHVVDGARFWACEIWWLLQRWHSRFLQTGRIQRYMFVVLFSAAVLCVVVAKPLGQIFARILGRM